MIARFEAPPAARSNHIVAAVGCAVAFGLVSVRFLEAPENPATYLRLLVSIVAVASVVIARRQSLLRRATIFVALEALGGLLAFTYVDLPFVLGHQHQIDQLALLIYQTLHH
jgi:4-amino-4-deoxy-L-arabinose transferase-like glycosyltransferase